MTASDPEKTPAIKQTAGVFLLQDIAISARRAEHTDEIIHILENIGQNEEGKREKSDTADDHDREGEPVGSTLFELDVGHVFILFGDIVVRRVHIHFEGRLNEGRQGRIGGAAFLIAGALRLDLARKFLLLHATHDATQGCVAAQSLTDGGIA